MIDHRPNAFLLPTLSKAPIALSRTAASSSLAALTSAGQAPQAPGPISPSSRAAWTRACRGRPGSLNVADRPATAAAPRLTRARSASVNAGRASALRCLAGAVLDFRVVAPGGGVSGLSRSQPGQAASTARATAGNLPADPVEKAVIGYAFLPAFRPPGTPYSVTGPRAGAFQAAPPRKQVRTLILHDTRRAGKPVGNSGIEGLLKKSKHKTTVEFLVHELHEPGYPIDSSGAIGEPFSSSRPSPTGSHSKARGKAKRRPGFPVPWGPKPHRGAIVVTEKSYAPMGLGVLSTIAPRATLRFALGFRL